MKWIGWATTGWFAFWVGFCVGRELSRPIPIEPEPIYPDLHGPGWWTTKALAAGRN